MDYSLISGTVATALNGIKTANAVVSSLLDLKIEAGSLKKVTEALQSLGTAQDTMFQLRETLFELQTENEKLRKEISARDDWDTKIAQYDLAKTDGGAVVYKFKGEPQYYVCPSCVINREIHILQDRKDVKGCFRCPKCKADFPILNQKIAGISVISIG